MKEARHYFCVGLLIGTVVGGVIIGLFANVAGQQAGVRMVQDAAAKYDAGYYEADPKTGAVIFRWREFPPRSVILRPGGKVEVP